MEKLSYLFRDTQHEYTLNSWLGLFEPSEIAYRNKQERSEIKMQRYKKIIGSILCVCTLIFSGCSMEGVSGDNPTAQSKNRQEAALTQENKTSYTLETIPEYNGEPFVMLNENIPDFTEEDYTTKAFEEYSELDAYGRCGVAYANICKEIMPVEERGEIGMIKPSGWHTVKYDCVDGKYLYNRCHLIGYQLAGENANEKNLITGTRYFNVQGMLPFEDLIDEYVEQTNSHVLYRVTPIYEGNNLLASGAEMEAWSVEDNGKGVCFHVYVYNVQPGVGISYEDGESWLEEEQSEVSKDEEEKSNQKIVSKKAISKETISETEKEQTYILNKNTKKIHYASCRCIEDMSEQNKEEYIGTRSEILNQGYDACGVCKP